MAAQLRWAMVTLMRGDVTTSQVKCEGGTMRGSVQLANTLRGDVVTRGDATASWGKQECEAMRGVVKTSRLIERQW